MTTALYGEDGFFVRGTPADHFRTSVHATPLFAGAIAALVRRVDSALGHPEVLDVVDVGAGRGELLSALLALGLGDRVRFTAVEVAPRPDGLHPDIAWQREIPERIVGVLLATEWLDNVPLDVVEADEQGRYRKVLVDPATGVETLGGAPDAAEVLWINRWTPGGTARVEVGWTRDAAWAEAVDRVRRGVALAVDYGHLRGSRPEHGTLTGFRGGRQVLPIPDGSCDLTAHVAMDAVASAGGNPYTLISQREALTALGIDGSRPPLDLARSDPAAYLRALGGAGAAGELLDPAGLGGHWWLLHGIGIDPRGTMHA